VLFNYHIGGVVCGSLGVGESVRLGWSWAGRKAVRTASLQHGHYSNPAAPNLQHTTNREQNYRCGN